MIAWLMSLSVYAQPQARCTDLPKLYTKEFKSPLSKVYNSTLYALRSVPWEDFQKSGLQEDSVLEVGSDWLYWSSATSLDLVHLVQPKLWPDAEVVDQGDAIILETRTGRWKGQLEADGGLLLSKVNAQRELFPAFWSTNDSGCSVSMDSVQLPFIHVSPEEGVELSFGHERDTVQIAFPNETEIPKLFKKRPLGEWEPLKTTQTPSIVFAAGEEPLSILDAELLSIPKIRDQIQKFDKKLHFSPGTQVGIFGDDGIVSVPLQGWFGCPLPRWQIEWGLRSGEKIAPHRFKVRKDGAFLYVHALKGRIVAAGTEALLDDALSQEGTPWFSSPEAYESEHILARLNIPPSMYMFVGPLEYVELSLSIEESNWNIDFAPFTQSKVRPHQLFLTYFATLQKWKKSKKESIPPEVEQTLKRTATFSYTGEKSEHNHVWIEKERVFMEDESQQIWLYDPTVGILLCDKEMTEQCGSVK